MLSFKKNHLLNNDKFISLVIVLFFFVIVISMPIYDNVNSFYNLECDEKNKVMRNIIYQIDIHLIVIH